MQFKGKITGLEEIAVGLRHAADRVKDSARKQMHRSADKIVREAKLNTPVDRHNLEESIRKEVSYGDRRRLQITVIAGGEVNGVNVDQYAALIHEHYESMKPGKGTIAKRAKYPDRYIGSKFLERAERDNRQRLLDSMIETVKAVWYMK
jgi:ASC-1-like (ASCH) protein